MTLVEGGPTYRAGMRAFSSDVARRNLEFRQGQVKFSFMPVQWEFITAHIAPSPISRFFKTGVVQEFLAKGEQSDVFIRADWICT